MNGILWWRPVYLKWIDRLLDHFLLITTKANIFWLIHRNSVIPIHHTNLKSHMTHKHQTPCVSFWALSLTIGKHLYGIISVIRAVQVKFSAFLNLQTSKKRKKNTWKSSENIFMILLLHWMFIGQLDPLPSASHSLWKLKTLQKTAIKRNSKSTRIIISHYQQHNNKSKMLNCLLNQIMLNTKALSNNFHSQKNLSWAMRSFSIQGLSEKVSTL